MGSECSIAMRSEKSFNLQIVVKGAGRHFCAGIDVSSVARLMVANKDLGEGREQEKLRRDIKELQVRWCQAPSTEKSFAAGRLSGLQEGWLPNLESSS